VTNADDYNITIRIFEGGRLCICDAATVRQDFAPGEIYFNDPRESVDVQLSKEESRMIYKFRSKYPADRFPVVE
jgi:hypothetical protein